MRAIQVSVSTEYDVLVGKRLMENAPAEIRAVTDADSLCIVSDHTVWALYGNELKDSFTDAGFRCVAISFPPGENSKTPRNYIALLDFLAENHISRSDCIVALGGGVVGDLAGFAAATYLRGIDYIHIPTTVLAMVDSSVGGKTAIDLAAGKNLAGAFYQPKLVLCDTNALCSLPEGIFRDGCAEVIKYGVLYDPALFAHLQACGTGFDREWVIGRCVELKRDIVTADEFDRGQRQKLNLGHTIGHAIETESQFTVSHGQAVAIGMAMICRAAAKLGLCSKADADTVIALLRQFGLSTTTDIKADAIYKTALSDKKRNGGSVNLIVPRTIGRCDIVSVPTDELKNWILNGM